jgi:hypothetical protein
MWMWLEELIEERRSCDRLLDDCDWGFVEE